MKKLFYIISLIITIILSVCLIILIGIMFYGFAIEAYNAFKDINLKDFIIALGILASFILLCASPSIALWAYRKIKNNK